MFRSSTILVIYSLIYVCELGTPKLSPYERAVLEKSLGLIVGGEGYCNFLENFGAKFLDLPRLLEKLCTPPILFNEPFVYCNAAEYAIKFFKFVYARTLISYVKLFPICETSSHFLTVHIFVCLCIYFFICVYIASSTKILVVVHEERRPYKNKTPNLCKNSVLHSKQDACHFF